MTKTVDNYLKLPYTIELKPEPAGGWFVAVKELPGCMSQGDTPAEAIAMIQDAMRGWLAVALEDGETIPEPWADEDYSGKFVARVPRSLHRQLAETAEREGVSLNQYLNVALAGAVNQTAVKPVAPSLVAESDEPGWPGLSAAARRALQTANLAAEAGQQDERLFAEWAGGLFARCAQDYTEGFYKDAMRGLTTLAAHCRQFSRHSPVLETLAASYQWVSQIIEQSWRLQQGAQDTHLRAQIRQEITQFYPHADRAMLNDEKLQYSTAATQPEHDLSRELFASALPLHPGSQHNDW